MTQQALRELVAKWRADSERFDRDAKQLEAGDPHRNKLHARADWLRHCADELEALLGEQREAQGAVFTDNGDEIEARLKYDAEHSCPACGGSGHKDDVAPPLAEPDVEACAAEIQRWTYGTDTEEETEEFSPSNDRAEIAAIIRRHMVK